MMNANQEIVVKLCHPQTEELIGELSMLNYFGSYIFLPKINPVVAG